MKLLVDGRVFAHRQVTGVERYARQITAEFSAMGIGYEIAVPRSGNRYGQQVWEHSVLPCKAAGFDVLFCPANMAPLWKPPACRYVVTIHDLSFRSFKDSFSPAYRHYYEIATRRIMRLADRIITDSNHERGRIVEQFPETEGKIRVVYIGVGREFVPASNPHKKQQYILYVGSMNRRKNLAGVIRAFNSLKDRIPHKLVVVGAHQGIYINSAFVSDERIEYAGHTDDAALLDLYQHASALVFPSFYEGFGLPVLEAMACGCPVITSNSSSLPEVAGNAAVMVDPHDDAAISKALFAVVSDESMRRQMIERGKIQAGKFTWEKAAQNTMNVLHECVTRP